MCVDTKVLRRSGEKVKESTYKKVKLKYLIALSAMAIESEF